MLSRTKLFMPATENGRRPTLPLWFQLLAGILFLLAIVLRVSLYHVQTSDYTVFVSQWYDYIQNHGGFAALRYSFSNYNVPYLYLLAIATYLPIPKLIAIKSISVLFDVVLGIFTYLIINLKYSRSIAAVIGALVILFAPTIFINSAAWGQCDAIYTAFCLGGLYFLLKERPLLACIFFGVALSFKLQAVFFAPVLLVFLLKRRVGLQHLLIIPAIFLLLLTPALIAGRDVTSLMSIYVDQANTGGGGAVAGARPFGGGFGGRGGQGQQHNGGGPGQFNGGTPGQSNNGAPHQFNGGGARPANGGAPGQFGNGGGPGQFNGGGTNASSSSFTYNAPTFYQWLPSGAPEFWKWIGIALAGLFVVLVGVLLWRSKRPDGGMVGAVTTIPPSEIILKVTLVFALAIPFLLPEMHERYFYLADVVSIIYAFYFPRRFYIPIIMQLCSLLSYAPYLLNRQIIGLNYVAFGVLVITVITFVDLVLTLYPNLRKRSVGKLKDGRDETAPMITDGDVALGVAGNEKSVV
jgi:Gpi18-like mannosyltransferase